MAYGLKACSCHPLIRSPAACKLNGRPGVLTPKIAIGRPELNSRASVGRPDLIPLNMSLTLRTFSTSFEVHQPSK